MKSLADLPEAGGATPTPFDSLMKDAEGLLKSGKYMEAADAYQTAITTEPDNALALIGARMRRSGLGCMRARRAICGWCSRASRN